MHLAGFNNLVMLHVNTFLEINIKNYTLKFFFRRILDEIVGLILKL